MKRGGWYEGREERMRGVRKRGRMGRKERKIGMGDGEAQILFAILTNT